MPRAVHGLAPPWLAALSWLLHRLGEAPDAFYRSIVRLVIVFVSGLLAWGRGPATRS